jgi:agmatine/peptidylarginine deiminase
MIIMLDYNSKTINFMKIFLTILIILITALNIFSQDFDLPRYMTEEEKKIGNNYESFPPVNPIPPSTPVRTMAEWEELDGIIMTWTSYTFLLRQIVDAAQEEGMVWIICSDSNSVKTYLQGGGVPFYNISFIIAPYNTVWSRDYGPWCVYTLTGDTLGFVDFKYNRPRPLDDVIPVVLGTRWSVPVYQTISGPDSLAHTGGNFMVDGFGTSFRSRLTEIENFWHTTAHIDSILFRYCGIPIGRSVSMTVLPYDGIHHIDMHMKLLDEETLLVGQYPTGVADGPQIELNIQYIQNNYQNCYGRPYKIVRIPMPPDANGQYPPASHYFTYTNSLIVNKTVLVPIYNFPQDTTALRIYRENMPGYSVIGFDCNQIIPAGGAIHCITKEIGTRNPVLIYHARLQNTTDTVNNYTVNANIKNRYGIDSAFVHWSTDTSLGYNRIIMTNTGGGNWTAAIPHQSAGKTVYYYIRTRTSSGKYFSKPITAPRGHWKFNVIGPTGITGNQNSIPEKFKLYQNYPNPFNPVTKIKFDIPLSPLTPDLIGGTERGNKGGFATLVIYDILGREITTLVNQRLKPGTYDIQWNAANYPSGVYFYKLITGGYSETKIMIYLK